MSFQPRMTNSIAGFDHVGAWTRRSFGGVVADLWDVACAPVAGGHYVAADPRLFIVLETQGLRSRRMTLGQPGRRRSQPEAPVSRHLSFIPAGVALDLSLSDVRSIRHLDLHVDADALAHRLGSAFDSRSLAAPRLCLTEPRLLALADLMAAECASPAPLHDLYGDGLALSLLIALLDTRKTEPRAAGALAPWQLRRVTDFIEAECVRPIRLEELAQLTGLSAAHFSRAFKSATGQPPHRYQLIARIERAKRLLRAGELSLSDVASETGFADQPHLTRIFRQLVGVAPGQWRRGEGR